MDVRNIRAKLRRATDATVTQGWVVGEREGSFLFVAETDLEIAPGDPFICEFFALEWTVTSLAVARFVNEGSLTESGKIEVTVALEQVNTVSIQKASGNERLLVDGLSASLWGVMGRMASGCTVHDVSKRGLGVIVPDAVPVDSRFSVVVDGCGEPITMTCSVRYCRPWKKSFRVGLQLTSVDAKTAERWQAIVMEHNDRRKRAA